LNLDLIDVPLHRGVARALKADWRKRGKALEEAKEFLKFYYEGRECNRNSVQDALSDIDAALGR
jgi:hypothetical protein